MSCSLCSYTVYQEGLFKAVCGHVFHCDCVSRIGYEFDIDEIACPDCKTPWLSDDERNMTCDERDEWVLRSLFLDRVYPKRIVERIEAEQKDKARWAIIEKKDKANPLRGPRRKLRHYNTLRTLSGLPALDWHHGKKIPQNDENNFYDSDDGEHFTYVNGTWVHDDE